MQFLTQTKWPFPVALGLVVFLLVAENMKWLTAEQITWLMGALTLGGTQAGVHTDRPELPDAGKTVPPKHIVIPKDEP